MFAPSYLLLVPFVAIVILNLPARQMMKRVAPWTVAAIAFAQAILVTQCALKGPAEHCVDPIAAFFSYTLSADTVSAVVLIAIGIVIAVTLFVGKSILVDDDQRFNFSNLLLIAMIGLNGIVLMHDIFSLYVFVEIAAVTSYILISFTKDRFALEATFKYIVLSSVATAMMLAAVAIMVLIAGGTDFTTIRAALVAAPHSHLISFAIALFIAALAIKGGIVPFHGWLPDAYSAAPKTISIFLAGIVTKVVGVYALIRIVISVLVMNAAIGEILLAIGMLSILVGACAALGQRDMKRLLAYSSISQVGYIIVGLGCATPLGLFGAVFHFFNHAIFKSGLFVTAAAVEVRTGRRSLDQLGGLGSQMPVTALSSVIFSLSAAGLPPFAGFWSKLIIVVALWAAGYQLYAALAIIASVLTLAYLLLLQRDVFFGKMKEEFATIREIGAGVLVPMAVLAAITIIVGLAFPFMGMVPKP